MYDIAVLAGKHGLKTSMVSNGYLNPEPLRRLLIELDAVKIDLKSFSQDFYEEISRGELKYVLRSLKIVREEGVWLEIVNLVVPTLNDDPERIADMCRWIKEELGDDVPLHFIRFFPAYRMTHLPATPVTTLEKAYSVAKDAGIKYVYVGNVPGHTYNHTFCPNCGGMLIERLHFYVSRNNVQNKRCPYCGEPIAGYWR
jgi:pyruvate formate lyase activating enzyme